MLNLDQHSTERNYLKFLTFIINLLLETQTSFPTPGLPIIFDLIFLISPGLPKVPSTPCLLCKECWGSARFDIGSVQFSLVQYGLVRFGLVRFILVRFCSVLFDNDNDIQGNLASMLSANSSMQNINGSVPNMHQVERRHNCHY